jgi:hypothetical protein
MFVHWSDSGHTYIMDKMDINLSTIITGHGKLRAYFYRFKIIEEPSCPCKMSPPNIRTCTMGMRAAKKSTTGA